jgi:integrase
MKLDAKTVAGLTLPPGKADHFEWDSELSGFGYRLRRGSGDKVLRTWNVQYRRGGATRRLLLGPASVLNAEQARAAAKKVLAQVALGEDPQAARADRRGKDKLNLRAVIEEYLATRKPIVRRSTFREVYRYLTGPHFKPLHAMPVDLVSRKDVAARLVVIARERGSSTASRARTALSAFFVWAMTMGIVEANPVIGSPRPVESKPRERTLSDDELTAIWRACGDDDYGRVIRLLMLTSCRRQEVGNIAWSELDLEHSIWTIPAGRTKNHRQHTLPLMLPAQSIIATVPRMASRDQLFGQRGQGFTNWAEAKHDLDARSGVSGWTVHDIRRSVATRMADLGVQPHIIETVLNHQSGHKAGPAGIYNRSSYEREVKKALALWADHVRTLVEGGERKVVPMHRVP